MQTVHPPHQLSLQSIPAPRGLPYFGNLFQMPRNALVQHFSKVAGRYDGIFRLNFVGKQITFVSSPALVAELADSNRFRKHVGPPLSMLRALAGDGLFTADSTDPHWGTAHRILVPGFGQRAMRIYFDAMLEVSKQLIHKWQQTAGEPIDVTADMTRLTFDTIALCGFGYRFESFQSPEQHPFIEAMNSALVKTMLKLTQLRVLKPFNKAKERKLEADIVLMNKLVDDVIAQRHAKANTNSRDLLDLMLESRDPKTGEALSDTNMRYQVITFLIAGHETTSGLLSFALYYLLKDQALLSSTQRQVDEVLSAQIDQQLNFETLAKFEMIDRVLKETLRLWPTAPLYSVAPFEDTVIGKDYAIKKDHRLNVLLPALHRDPKIWKDPEQFNIDRFLPDNEAKIPPHAYKPFGNGERACIGRQFAITEAKIALALILRNFNLSESGQYHLAVNETLTLKPDGFKITASNKSHYN